MKATGPDGNSWSVTRRWLPWRRRTKDLDPGFDYPGVPDADDLLGVILLVVVLVLAIPFLLLAVLVAIELLALLLLLPFYVVARVLFGVSWEVEVRHRRGLSWPVVHTEKVHGWSESGRRINEIATEIRDGRMLSG